MKLVYTDNNATTKIDPAVLDEMLPFLKEYFGNPSSMYGLAEKSGMKIKEAVLAEANEILCYNFCCVQDPITVALKVVSVSGEFQANYTCRFIENFLVPVQSPKSASVLRHFSCCTIL